MIISVTVMPRSSQKKVVEDGNGLKVYVHESPTDGKANDAVKRMLADYYGVARSSVTIISGKTVRTKRIKIDT